MRHRAHYNAVFRPRRLLPPISQFHRRVRSERVRAILQRVHDIAGGRVLPTALASVDGEALPICPVSKDPDARRGYAGTRQVDHGYELHALASEGRRIITWCVRLMNEHEMPVARRLLASLPAGFFGAWSVLREPPDVDVVSSAGSDFYPLACKLARMVGVEPSR